MPDEEQDDLDPNDDADAVGDDAVEDDAEDDDGPRQRLEGLLRETLRSAIQKGIETGVGTISKADRAVRGVTGLELPKEVVGYLFSQVDDTKNALVRGVAREVRDFLEATDIAQEFQKALTTLSFEIKTEIRFIPNDSGGVKPSVKSRAVPRRKKRRGKKAEEAEAEASAGPDTQES